ncbi:MAG: SPOR domain-containing protein [Hydrogenophilus sp.]|nr:SPOR domain-containing protein [Hydrogenophilus sp.]
MRLLLALLLVTNAFLLGVQSGILTLPDPPRPDRIPQPLREDQIARLEATVRLTPFDPSPSVSSPPPAAALPHPSSPPSPPSSSSSSASSTPSPPPRHPPAPPPQPSPLPPSSPPSPAAVSPISPSAEPSSSSALSSPAACRRIELPPNTDPRLMRELLAPFPTLKSLFRTQTEAERWWVVTPKQANETAAKRLSDHLARQGIGDRHILRDPGPNQWRISLGLFSSRERAEAHLKALKARGVNGLEIIPKNPITRTTVTIEGPEKELDRLLARLTARIATAQILPCPSSPP